MNLKACIPFLIPAMLGAAPISASAARDHIDIVGSSTVFPFATVVAERFGRSGSYKTPKVESTGSGGGLKLFCAGIGTSHPDITNASRRIKQSEFDRCKSNGVDDIIEVKIGYDGIALANSKQEPQMSISLKQIFLALAKQVPDPAAPASGKLVDNPYKKWSDIDASLPDYEIEVLGPPPTSGTRDAFAELALEGGCKKIDWIKAMKKKDKHAYKALCHTIREDGAYVEAGENDNLIIQKLVANPEAFGVFGFSFLDQNTDKVQGSLVDGEPPEFESISNGDYKLSRSLFFYVKKAHVGSIPGIREYLAEFTSEKAFGDEGYLADKGLIPMPRQERAKYQAVVKNLTTLKKL